MTTSAVHPVPSSRVEDGFSIVEVIVAALVLAFVVAGATAVFTSSTRSVSASRVHDRQTAVANEAMAQMQGDPSWAAYCRSRRNPFNAARPDCDLNPWLATRPAIRNMGNVTDATGERMEFHISAIATGVDLQADGLNGNDADGVRPDVYRLRITIVPDSGLVRRFGNLGPVTMQQETNPTSRVLTGRVTINACLVLNQIDERAAAGDCTGSAQAAPLVPPGGLDTSSRATTYRSCTGPVGSSGGDGRDCGAFKCSNFRLARPNPGLVTPCEQHSGWSQSIFSQPWAVNFTRMLLGPARGTVTLRRQTDGYRKSVRLDSGTAHFRDMPFGTYDVLFDVPGYERWRSKSVPSSGAVAVEPGLNSRAVLMYRPAATGRVDVRVRSVDASRPPWEIRNLTGYVKIDEWGRIIQGGRERIYLVPVPQGRLLRRDMPFIEVPVSSSTQWFRFTKVPPGLYSFELADENYVSFKHVQNTAGFIYVGTNGATYYGDRQRLQGRTPEFVNGLCARYVREGYLGRRHVNPDDPDQVWNPKPCSSPRGPGPSHGTGGGGTA